ncbi:MAG: N-acetylmuramoyl-L-alanine amidase [Clostridia bacterium]|nr:N-acetylmuramoyl-L-alanine amidase [Clostridia bacterium]
MDDTPDSGTSDENSVIDVPSQKPLDDLIIVLDPGHGYFSENFKEPVAPGSSEMKNAFAVGTAGDYLSEAEFNLIVAQKLEPLLTEQGADVYFTRSDENSISNVERAVFANDLNADLAVRIHADGSSDETVSGISVLVPADGTVEEDICSESNLIGEMVLDSLIHNTGANNRGLIQRSDLTGFNWSEVPVVLIECGFMSNPQEDLKLSSDAYQNLIVTGIAEAIINYYSEN